MNYSQIAKALNEYENMTSEEVQNDLKPIIKKYNKDFLSVYLGVSKDHLYRICKKLFVENDEKVSFSTYIKIMNLGENKSNVGFKKIECNITEENKRKIEERKKKRKEYQKKYYKEVLKKKRAAMKSNI